MTAEQVVLTVSRKHGGILTPACLSDMIKAMNIFAHEGKKQEVAKALQAASEKGTLDCVNTLNPTSSRNAKPPVYAGNWHIMLNKDSILNAYVPEL